MGVPGEVLSKDVKDFGALEHLVASWVYTDASQVNFLRKQTQTNMNERKVS